MGIQMGSPDVIVSAPKLSNKEGEEIACKKCGKAVSMWPGKVNPNAWPKGEYCDQCMSVLQKSTELQKMNKTKSEGTDMIDKLLEKYLNEKVSPYSKRSIRAASRPGRMISTKCSKCGKEIKYRSAAASGTPREMICRDCAGKEKKE